MRFSTLFNFIQHTSDCASWIARSLPGDSIAVSAMVYASKDLSPSKFAERRMLFRLERWEACSRAAVTLTSNFTSYDLVSHRDTTAARGSSSREERADLLTAAALPGLLNLCSAHSLLCLFFALLILYSAYSLLCSTAHSLLCLFSALLDCISLLDCFSASFLNGTHLPSVDL